MIPFVDEVTRALFVNRLASPSELLAMTYRELTWFFDAAIEHARLKKEETARREREAQMLGR